MAASIRQSRFHDLLALLPGLWHRHNCLVEKQFAVGSLKCSRVSRWANHTITRQQSYDSKIYRIFIVALHLHCSFQCLLIAVAEKYVWKTYTHTDKHTTTIVLLGLCPPRQTLSWLVLASTMTSDWECVSGLTVLELLGLVHIIKPRPTSLCFHPNNTRYPPTCTRLWILPTFKHLQHSQLAKRLMPKHHPSGLSHQQDRRHFWQW